MFTGLVELLGVVDSRQARPPGVRLVVRAGHVAEGARVGESVSVNGCCLTVVEAHGELLSFDAGEETLARTNLGRLAAGSPVNLERSLRVGDRLGGHLVSGHIDAVGRLVERQDNADWSTCWFSMPERLARQMASKGSIAVDGVSLTLVEVRADRFSVALIPHTLAATTLGRLAPGGEVNLETDLLAKYVESQLAGVRGVE
jgi:riboflavin synthase